MTVQGVASASTSGVLLPAHQPGDMLLVFARASTAPGKPPAAGTTPNWNIAQTGAANTLGLTAGWYVATASNHTTGTWSPASQIYVMVLRPATGMVLNLPTSSLQNANNVAGIVYPALTLTVVNGTSWGVRCGTRGAAALTVENAPSGWTNQLVHPAGAPVSALHTRAGLVANPTLDSVPITGGAAYRALTLEITESSNQQPMVMII